MYKSHLICYPESVKRQVNKAKDNKNKEHRGRSVLEIVENGVLLSTLKNPNHPGQYLRIYRYQNYAWVVVVGEAPPRYVTHYPSRKFRKKYAREFK